MKTVDRILNSIALNRGCTTRGLLGTDLRLKPKTVDAHVDRLLAGGRVGIAWDGNGLELTDTEIKDRATDARVRSRR